MAKKSFILYYDQKEIIDELDDEQAGKLFKAIFEYNVNKKITLKGVLKLIFIPFKTSFDRDESKWEDIIEKRKNAGKLGAKKRWENDNNMANDSKRWQEMANIAVSVSDSVNVNDSVSVSVNNITLPPNTPTEIFEFCVSEFPNYDKKDLDRVAKKIFEHYKKIEWKNVENWQERTRMWVEEDIGNGKIKEDTSKNKYEVIDGITYKNGKRLL